MSRQNSTNFTGAMQFPYATAGTDIFLKEDIQLLAYAVDNHRHVTGEGALLPSSALTFPITFPDGSTIHAPVGGTQEIGITPSLVVGAAGGGNLTCGRILSSTSELYLGDTTAGITRSGGNQIYGGGGSGTTGNHYFWKNLSGTYADIFCGGITASSGISCTVVSVNDGANGIVNSGAGALYLRGASGTVLIDGVNGLTVSPGNVNVGGNVTAQAGLWIIQGTHGIQKSGPNVLYQAVGGGHYMWADSGVYTTVYAAAFSVSSALKVKTDVRPIEDPLSIVLDPSLHGISYTDKTSGKPMVGFVADSWKPVVPEIVAEDDDGEVMSMDYARVGAITFEALKQFATQTSARLDALEAGRTA
ncbi:MAG TPA: hypothetical protein VIQ02_00710 [Jiangellaceae bacterium]